MKRKRIEPISMHDDVVRVDWNRAVGKLYIFDAPQGYGGYGCDMRGIHLITDIHDSASGPLLISYNLTQDNSRRLGCIMDALPFFKRVYARELTPEEREVLARITKSSKPSKLETKAREQNNQKPSPTTQDSSTRTRFTSPYMRLADME